MGVYLRVDETVAVTGVSLNISSYNFSSAGETLQLIATVSPSDADNKNIIWSSDNANYTVDQNGLVTCLSGMAGIGYITATTEDGGYTATCQVSAGK